MFITVRVSLQPYTTEEYAKELGNNIASNIKDAVGPGPSQHVDKVYMAVDEGDGNYVGP